MRRQQFNFRLTDKGREYLEWLAENHQCGKSAIIHEALREKVLREQESPAVTWEDLKQRKRHAREQYDFDPGKRRDHAPTGG